MRLQQADNVTPAAGGPPPSSRRGRGSWRTPPAPEASTDGSCGSGDRRLFKEKHLTMLSPPVTSSARLRPCGGFSGSTSPVLKARPPALERGPPELLCSPGHQLSRPCGWSTERLPRAGRGAASVLPEGGSVPHGVALLAPRTVLHPGLAQTESHPGCTKPP